MINKISIHILNIISRHIEISPNMLDTYRYRIEIIISSILNIVLILICSLIFKNIRVGIKYLFVFILLHFFSEGYHTASYFRCNLIFAVFFVITYFAFKIVTFFKATPHNSIIVNSEIK